MDDSALVYKSSRGLVIITSCSRKNRKAYILRNLDIKTLIALENNFFVGII